MISVGFGARRVPRVVLSILLLAASAVGLEAQDLSGRVLRGDTPVAGVSVELHRVTRDTAGVVERTTTDASGSFRLTPPPVDTAGFTVFFATAEYLGIRYFGNPLHPSDARDGYSIAVFDTVAAATSQGAIRIVRRDVVAIPDPTGSWEINEIVQLVNTGGQTLVAPTGRPTFEFRIPAEATSFQAGETETEAAELVQMDDRVLLTAPLVPGPREIFVRYRIPRTSSEVRYAFDAAVEMFNVYVAEPAPAVAVTGLTRQPPLEADGRTFASWGGAVEAGAEVVVGWPGAAPPIDPRTAALVIVGVFLLLGAVLALRGRRGGGSAPGSRGGAGRVPVASVVREPAPAEASSPRG